MTSVRVTSTLGDLASDLSTITAEAKPTMAKAVRKSATEGNRIARLFASQQHTMHSAIDVPYQESFSAEAVSAVSWVYGPTDNHLPHGGSQATGYELGSRNQPPHLDLARSADIIGPKFASDALDAVDALFWPGA